MSKLKIIHHCPTKHDLNGQVVCIGFAMHPNGEGCEYISMNGICSSETTRKIWEAEENEKEIEKCDHKFYVCAEYNFVKDENGINEIKSVRAKCRCCGKFGDYFKITFDRQKSFELAVINFYQKHGVGYRG